MEKKREREGVGGAAPGQRVPAPAAGPGRAEAAGGQIRPRQFTGCRCPLPATGQAGAACSACRAGGAEPRGMGLGPQGGRGAGGWGAPGCLGLLVARMLRGGGRAGWGAETTLLGEPLQKLSPKPSGTVLSRAEPGQREPGFRQRLTQAEAQGRVRSLELDPISTLPRHEACQ